LQPLQNAKLKVRFQGPALIYPINRVKETPLAAYTVVDVMRNALGVGPCEHLLDLEGQRIDLKGVVPCAARDLLDAIYKQGRQKQQRATINRSLDGALAFVTHIRGRVTHYIAFGHQLREYLAGQRQAHPELADFLAEMDGLTQQIDAWVTRASRAKLKLRTVEDLARLNEDFRKNVLDYDGPDALKRCQAYTHDMTLFATALDRVAAECRLVVRRLRQRAGILTAQDPRVAPIAAEIRARTQEALRNPAWMERPRN
jgi:hypothetical protein